MKTELPFLPNRRFLSSLVTPVFLLLITSGCRVEPEPIDYGSDGCHFCRMTIVDQQHGAELVTTKGKVFKFDAVECMLYHLNQVDSQAVAFLMVNTYSRPGELVEATQATYLVSEGIPSPMGEFLTAFENESAALEAQKEHGGELYSWERIKNQFKK